MGLLYERAGRLNTKNGGFRPGQGGDVRLAGDWLWEQTADAKTAVRKDTRTRAEKACGQPARPRRRCKPCGPLPPPCDGWWPPSVNACSTLQKAVMEVEMDAQDGATAAVYSGEPPRAAAATAATVAATVSDAAAAAPACGASFVVGRIGENRAPTERIGANRSKPNRRGAVGAADPLVAVPPPDRR